MKTRSRKSNKVPLFARRAQRAMKRATRNVIAQHRAAGLPVIVWENGKVVEKFV